jgi:hypothetical protein
MAKAKLNSAIHLNATPTLKDWCSRINELSDMYLAAGFPNTALSSEPGSSFSILPDDMKAYLLTKVDSEIRVLRSVLRPAGGSVTISI